MMEDVTETPLTTCWVKRSGWLGKGWIKEVKEVEDGQGSGGKGEG